jgi:hypothetical protein
MQSTVYLNSTTSSTKKLFNNIKKVVIKAGRKVRSLFNKKPRTINNEENKLIDSSSTISEMPFIKKCEAIVDTGIEAATSIYQLVKEDYFPVVVEFYHNHKTVLNFMKPETVTLVENMYPVVKTIVESESVQKSPSILSLIKNVSMEVAQMVVNKFTSARLNVEMVVAEAAEALENSDISKMVEVVCKVLIHWEKTRVIVELYHNMSVDYLIELIGNWLMDKYIR